MVLTPEYEPPAALVNEVQRLRIEDGDIVVVRCDQILTKEQAEVMAERVRRALSQASRKAPVLVLSGGIDIEILKSSQLPIAASD